jgi:hypothetical protein
MEEALSYARTEFHPDPPARPFQRKWDFVLRSGFLIDIGKSCELGFANCRMSYSMSRELETGAAVIPGYRKAEVIEDHLCKR